MKLDVEFAGLKLENPVIVASSQATDREHLIRRAAEYNPGAIIIKSAFVEEDLKRLFPPYAGGQFPGTRPYWSRAGNSYIRSSSRLYYPPEIWAEIISRLKKEIRMPIIGSAITSSIDNYVKVAKILEQAGADAFEVSFCPLPTIEESGFISVESAWDMDLVKKIVRQVKAAVSFPVGVKGDPHPLFPDTLTKAAFVAGADWVHHTCYAVGAPGVDIETGRPLLPGLSNNGSGPMRKYLTFRTVDASAKAIDYTKFHFTASGGIMNWRDAVEYIMYGCTTIQLCAAIAKRGFKAIREVINGLQQYGERKGLERITDIRGIAQKYQLASEDTMIYSWQETKGKIIAEVDIKRCNLCGVCVDPCLEQAIDIREDRLLIDRDKCEGCGLCWANCPADAIKMLNVDMLFEIEKRRGLGR